MRIPHWASVLIALAVVIIAWVVQQNTAGNLVLPVVVISVLTLVQPLLAALSPSAVTSTNVKAAMATGDVLQVSNVAKMAAKIAPLACLLLVSGCISSAPIVPVTPANTAQVSSCESSATVHNDFVIGGFVLGGITAGLGAAGAVATDSTAKTDLAISAAAVGGAMLIDTAITGFSAQNFANSQCTSVVGALPVGPLGKTTVTVTAP